MRVCTCVCVCVCGLIDSSAKYIASHALYPFRSLSPCQPSIETTGRSRLEAGVGTGRGGIKGR